MMSVSVLGFFALEKETEEITGVTLFGPQTE